MFGFRPVSKYFPQPNSEPMGGRPFRVEPMINHKRDAIHASPQMGFLLSQDFMDIVDTRTILVNGDEVSVVTKADFDVIGAALGERKRRELIRNGRRQAEEAEVITESEYDPMDILMSIDPAWADAR